MTDVVSEGKRVTPGHGCHSSSGESEPSKPTDSDECEPGPLSVRACARLVQQHRSSVEVLFGGHLGKDCMHVHDGHVHVSLCLCQRSMPMMCLRACKDVNSSSRVHSTLDGFSESQTHRQRWMFTGTRKAETAWCSKMAKVKEFTFTVNFYFSTAVLY